MLAPLSQTCGWYTSHFTALIRISCKENPCRTLWREAT